MFKLPACSAFLKEVVPQSDHQMVEFIEELHRVVAVVFGQNLYLRVENDISAFEETFMGAMPTHNPKMTPNVHVLSK